MARGRRIDDPMWLREEIGHLINRMRMHKDAHQAAVEQADRACNEVDKSRELGRVEVTYHAIKELERILRGETRAEALAKEF